MCLLVLHYRQHPLPSVTTLDSQFCRAVPTQQTIVQLNVRRPGQQGEHFAQSLTQQKNFLTISCYYLASYASIIPRFHDGIPLDSIGRQVVLTLIIAHLVEFPGMSA